MGTQRASNKDILGAIEALTAAIVSTMVAPVAAPVVARAAEIAGIPLVVAPEATPVSDLQIDKGYLSHMATKCQAFANDKGLDIVEYARHNLDKEVKLAYCTAERFAGLKDRGFIGTVAYYSPEA